MLISFLLGKPCAVKGLFVVNCSGPMHPYAPMYIGSVCPMQYARKQVAQTELARQRMRGSLPLGRVARAHLNLLFEQHSRQGSSLKSAFLLACLNLTLLHRRIRASTLLLSVSCLKFTWFAEFGLPV